MTAIMDDESPTYHLNGNSPNYRKHSSNKWSSTTLIVAFDDESDDHE
jgi:hypothetical protein